jgi:site-specific DNA recombinase
MTTTPRLRCAVYTRKSTEEGLDQEFNSLDAQFEACAAYIASQVGLGWKLVLERYDDGGISGGTMERPALQRLLQDIRDRKVDVVVVYKIDRLTRSLMDFSKIVEVFDRSSVSFVSVTQQFNTTTSMGRLTLNVLLSFAQFEREVTAERIRDKIAASKKKGMWMGGTAPLGYRVENRKLVIDPNEAATVRRLFDRYLELKSVRALVEDCSLRGLSGRSSTRARDGGTAVTRPFGRGNLYHLLSNPIYVGKIKHRERVYDGEHASIIDPEVFAAVQVLLKAQAPSRRQATNNADVHLLTGSLFDEAGDKLRSVHANKQGVRYRYYVSKNLVEERRGGRDGWRLPAGELESIVARQVERILADQPQLARWIEALAPTADAHVAMVAASGALERFRGGNALERRTIVRQLFVRVTLKTGAVVLDANPRALLPLLGVEPTADDQIGGEALLTITCPVSLRRRGVELRVVLTNGDQANRRQPDPGLINLVSRARRYLGHLTDGEERSLADVASLERTDPSEISRLLPLAFLSPTIVESIVQGTQPVQLTAQTLSRVADLPVAWPEQHQLLLD